MRLVKARNCCSEYMWDWLRLETVIVSICEIG